MKEIIKDYAKTICTNDLYRLALNEVLLNDKERGE